MDFFCVIHLANVPISEKFTLKCNHSFCRECLLHHCTEKLKELQIKENQFICPDSYCSKPLDIFDIKQILSPQDFEKYDDYLVELAMSKENNEIDVNCPIPTCGKKFFIWKNADYFTCSYCRITFCAKCKNEYGGHLNLTCEQYNEKLKTQEDKEFEKLIKKEKLMRCPVCSIVVERIRFCNVITCQSKVCQKKNCFCYLCGELLAENEKEKHFLDNNTYSNECENTIKHKIEVVEEKKMEYNEQIYEEGKVNEESKENSNKEIKIQEKKINVEFKEDNNIEFNEKMDNKNIILSQIIEDNKFSQKEEKKIFEKIYENESNDDKKDQKNIDFEIKNNEDQHKTKNDKELEVQKNIDFKNDNQGQSNHYEECIFNLDKNNRSTQELECQKNIDLIDNDREGKSNHYEESNFESDKNKRLSLDDNDKFKNNNNKNINNILNEQKKNEMKNDKNKSEQNVGWSKLKSCFCLLRY